MSHNFNPKRHKSFVLEKKESREFEKFGQHVLVEISETASLNFPLSVHFNSTLVIIYRVTSPIHLALTFGILGLSFDRTRRDIYLQVINACI